MNLFFNFLADMTIRAPTPISFMLTLLGIAILSLPFIIVYRYFSRNKPQWKFTATGIVFGFVILPLSFWLYFQYYVGFVRAFLFGFVGLFMIMIHSVPFRSISIPFLLEATDTSEGKWGQPIAKYLLTAGLFWAIIYGLVGYVVDRIRCRKKAS